MNASARALAYSPSAHGAEVSRHSIRAGSSVSACEGPTGTHSPHCSLASATAVASGSISVASRDSSAIRPVTARAPATSSCSA